MKRLSYGSAPQPSFVSEAIRILAPGGLLYMNTTNVLCPKQQEFNLPLFSWYPKPLKEHYIKLASTTRPELANYATYPAYHWFSPYRIKKYLAARGLSSADRFDVAFFYKAPGFDRRVIGTIRKLPPLRYLAHMMSPCITVLAQKTH